MIFFRSNIDVGLAPAPIKRATGKSSAHTKPDSRVPLAENTLLGTRLGGYRIEHLIGLGSFSLVYSALEIGSRRRVIIKEYFPKHYAKRNHDYKVVSLAGNNQAAFAEGFKQFYNEVLVLKKVKHPNVLDVHDLLRTNNTIYLVSLNQEGRDLKWFLSSITEPLEQNLIYKVFMPILSALHFLHDAQLLHLDIKPANILLQPNSKSLLLDFGAVKMLGTSMQPRQKRVVTHGFAPPEQYDKDGSLGPWTDIYAIAATLYYSITGKPPGKSKDRKKSSRLDLEYYSKIYHVELLQAINRALLYDVSERFGTVDEFAVALLAGSRWASLVEYETDVMAFDRYAFSTRYAQEELASFAA